MTMPSTLAAHPPEARAALAVVALVLFAAVEKASAKRA